MIPQTTPEAYQKMSPTQKRKFDKQVDKALSAQERAIEDLINERNKKLVADLASLIAAHPRLEWEIVSKYCERNGKVLASK